MSRKEQIQAQAIEHKLRGIYDNAMCKTGLERNSYAESWNNN